MPAGRLATRSPSAQHWLTGAREEGPGGGGIAVSSLGGRGRPPGKEVVDLAGTRPVGALATPADAVEGIEAFEEFGEADDKLMQPEGEQSGDEGWP